MEQPNGPVPATIAVFDHVMEAEIARGRLEAEGIRAFVQDENLVVQNWLYRNAVRGLRLQVSSEDEVRAIEILNSMKFDDEALDPDGLNQQDDEACPVCDSDRLEYIPPKRRATYLSWLLLGFPLLTRPRQTRCLNCGHVWASTTVAFLRLWAFLLLTFGILALWAGWEYRSLWSGLGGALLIVGALRLTMTRLEDSGDPSLR